MKNIFSKKSLALLIATLVVLSSFATSLAVVANADTTELDVWNGEIATGYAGGTGTEKDPFQIATPEQLALMVTTSGADTSGKYYKLMVDMYLNDTTNPDWKNDSPLNWCAPEKDNFFRGNFDGGNHTVYGLYYNGIKQDAALFAGVRGSSVVIKNLVISNAELITTADYAAAFVGQIFNTTTAVFENCYVDENVKVSAKRHASGFVAGGTCNSVSFKNCASFATVSKTGTDSARIGSFFGGLIYNNGTGDARKISYNNCIGNIAYTTYVQYPTYTASYCAVEGTVDSNSSNKIYPTVVALEDMKGAAAEENMPDLDWNGTWATTDGFPVFKSMLPEAPDCQHATTKGANVVEPTYFTAGSKDIVCSDCEEVLEENIAIDRITANPITYEYSYDAKAAALTINGKFSDALVLDMNATNGAKFALNYTVAGKD